MLNWLESTLAKHNLTPVGEPESVLDRPWAAVWRVNTDAGTFYLKSPCDANRSESAVTRCLRELAPNRVPKVVADSPENGWFLTEDGGPTLREHFDQGGTQDQWRTILADYARIQIQAIS